MFLRYFAERSKNLSNSSRNLIVLSNNESLHLATFFYAKPSTNLGKRDTHGLQQIVAQGTFHNKRASGVPHIS